MPSSGPLGEVYIETLAIFEQRDDPAEPLTTPEVADSLDCARRTVYKRLEKLVEYGELKTKKTGARARVWWVPLRERERDATAETTSTSSDSIERKRLEQELRAEKELFQVALENSPFTAFRLDTDLRYTWVGNPHPDFDAEAVIGLRDDELLPPEAAEIILKPKRTALETGKSVREECTYELPSGLVTYDLTVEPIRDDSGEVVGITCAALNITKGKQLERSLTLLHDTSRDLTQATSKLEASHRIIDAITNVLDIDSAVIYLFDDTDNTLQPVAATEQLEEILDELPTFRPDESSMAWQTFVNNETIAHEGVVNSLNVNHTDSSFQTGAWIPLGDHGVIAIISEKTDELAEPTQTVLDQLVATGEATLDRIEREKSIREQKNILTTQNRRLEDLSRVNDIIRGIDQVLVQARTTEEIEQAVCNRLTRDDRFTFAWIGHVGGEVLAPQTWVGTEPGYLDDITLSTDVENGDPAIATAVTRTVTLVQNVAEGFRDEPWRKAALAHGFQSVISIPIQYDGIQYGILTVYASESEAFDPLSRDVMAELGNTIANAINAVETRQALLTDSVVELELTIHDADSPLARLATQTGGDFTVWGAVPQQDGRTRIFITVDGVTAAMFEAAAGKLAQIEHVSCLDDPDEENKESRFELLVAGKTVPSTLTKLGAAIKTIQMTDADISIVIELSRSTTVGTFIDRLEHAYPNIELRARRDTQRGDQSAQTDEIILTEDLTDRQREVLQTAYLNGYFEWPRDRTGEEVAKSLNITQSTFNNHLRQAERKLLSRIFTENLPSSV
ncbi:MULTISPECIES: bacterio-opsin activator domain-containing protein [unclassified Haladaptatus]|uniref:bacterio-opsin activator domain-containing protein n=1 Tax=unclassified Haladaptatus TaxID=2622732 RepID=UPI00209C6891|nr:MULTISPECIES: bacterio-opsin activator domain-containing protein [unclassified Haladaptatus]MCO8244939.1 helix-turn-helix domain-containing protein [Haladaptatus sp. AB643]MCO8255548.1 helix-turn-helix domain-containing protein [Haladaptatus sp. AB618]